MSRFHLTPGNLEADGAMKHYRDFAPLKREGMDPAEWIEALHREHWLVLEQLRQARAATADARLLQLTTDVQTGLAQMQTVQTDLFALHTNLELVLGDTPAVERVKGAMADHRRAMRALAAALEAR